MIDTTVLAYISFKDIEDIQMFLLNLPFYFTSEVDNIYIS